MINSNVLKFGYGDIAVGANSSNQEIRFQQFKPPGKCGDKVSENVEYIGEKIVMKISYEDYCELSKLLKEVSDRNISIFEFKGYVFDFTKYNEESIKVCKRNLNNAMAWYFLCIAA